MRVGQQKFREAGINEDAAKDEPPDPDDRSAKVEWAGLHHGFLNYLAERANLFLGQQLIEKLLQNVVGHDP